LTGLTCRTNWTGLSYRRKTKNIKSELGGFLVKKGCEEGGLSLYRAYIELIGSLYESWTIGIERVCKKLINSIIQRCKKWQKEGFEAKEKRTGTRP